MNQLSFQYDSVEDILTIEGKKYSGELFRVFAMPDDGCLYRIVSKDETVILTKYTDRTILKIAQLIDEGKY